MNNIYIIIIIVSLFFSCKNSGEDALEEDNFQFENNTEILRAFYNFDGWSKFDSLWEGIRPEIRDSIIKIEDKTISSGIVGITGSIDPAFYTRRWIYKNGTVDEFKKLKHHPVINAKVMAYESLFYKEKNERYNLLIEASKDTTFFFYFQSGCISTPYLLSEYLFEHRLNFSLYREIEYDDYVSKHFTKEEFLNLKEIYKKIELNKDSWYKKSDVYWNPKIEKL